MTLLISLRGMSGLEWIVISTSAVTAVLLCIWQARRARSNRRRNRAANQVRYAQNRSTEL